jgi:hypothetical protein
LKVSASSTHKSQYKAGEIFDKTGLVAVVVYDDFSTVEIDASQLTPGTSAINPLTKNSKQVEFTYNGLKLRVSVTMVTEDAPVVGGDSSSEETSDSEGKTSGCGSVMASATAIVALLGAACVMVCKKKEN